MSSFTSNEAGSSPGSPGGRSSPETTEASVASVAAPFELFEEGFVACPEVSCIQLEHWSKAELVDVDIEISSATIPFVDIRGGRMGWEFSSTCNVPSLEELFESPGGLVASEVGQSQLGSKADLADVDDETSSATIPYHLGARERLRSQDFSSTLLSLAELSMQDEVELP